MTTFWIIDYACLALILLFGVLVVALTNLNSAVVALSGLGVILTVIFVVLHAPDVAHSEVVVGAIVVPTLYLIAVGKVRSELKDTRGTGEEGRPDE